jgi:hypothetical protein
MHGSRLLNWPDAGMLRLVLPPWMAFSEVASNRTSCLYTSACLGGTVACMDMS